MNFEKVPHKASFTEQPCGKLFNSCNILVPEFQLADTVKYYFTDVFQAFYKKREERESVYLFNGTRKAFGDFKN